MADSGGLYIHIMPTGSKLWRFKYRYGGKQKTLALGIYPDVSLKRAREMHNEARQLLAEGIDSGAHRKATKQRATNTFKSVALEWFDKQKGGWSESYRVKVMRHIERYLGQSLGGRPIDDIEPPELLQTLRGLEAKGLGETVHVAHQTAGRIFAYGIATGRCARNPANDIRGALAVTKVTNRPAVTKPEDVGALLRAIDDYHGDIVTVSALRLLPLVFVRPGELRHARWDEIDIEAALWRIPADKMKMRRDHLVPLSRQAMEILEDLRKLTGPGGYVFPSIRTRARPMSENTLNAALRRMGYAKHEMTSHGFRAMASTLLHELGWDSQVIERQLAHVERSKVKAAYNRAERLDERKRMMQAWADYLDGLKTGAVLITLRSSG